MRNELPQLAGETNRCLRCRRPLKSGAAYGPKCAAKIRQTRQTADLSAWTPAQIEEAKQAIEDGAVVPSTREGVFHVVSTDGSEVHRTHRHGCNCVNGMKTLPPRPCWHRAAIAILTGSTAPAAPAPARIAIPAQAVPVDDIWAEFEASGALDAIPAF